MYLWVSCIFLIFLTLEIIRGFSSHPSKDDLLHPVLHQSLILIFILIYLAFQ